MVCLSPGAGGRADSSRRVLDGNSLRPSKTIDLTHGGVLREVGVADYEATSLLADLANLFCEKPQSCFLQFRDAVARERYCALKRAPSV